jgi:hypothetical protein|tara:strand:+ start:876 stop:1028 length:153 start_codon:yes stop_codon:yes gene_type:complete
MDNIDFSLDIRRWQKEDPYGFAVAMSRADDWVLLRESPMQLILPAANDNE